MLNPEKEKKEPYLYLNTDTPAGAIALRILAGSTCYMGFMSIFLKDYTVTSWQFDMFGENKSAYQLGLVLVAVIASWISYLVVENKKVAQGIQNKSDEMRSEVISDTFYQVAKADVAREGFSLNPLTYYTQRQAIKDKVNAVEKDLNSESNIENKWTVIDAADDLIASRMKNELIEQKKIELRLFENAVLFSRAPVVTAKTYDQAKIGNNND